MILDQVVESTILIWVLKVENVFSSSAEASMEGRDVFSLKPSQIDSTMTMK